MGGGSSFSLHSQVLLCLIAVMVCNNVWQFSPKVFYFGKYFFVLRWLPRLAELFALIWGYENGCAVGLLKFWTSSWKIFLRFHFPVEKYFLASLQEEKSVNLCGWLETKGCVCLLLNYVISSCSLEEERKTYWKAGISLSDTGFISSPLLCSFTFLTVPSHVFPPHLSPSTQSYL